MKYDVLCADTVDCFNSCCNDKLKKDGNFKVA